MLVTFSDEVKEGLAPLLAGINGELVLPICRLAVNGLMGKQTYSEFVAFMKQNTELTGDNSKFVLKALQEIFYESSKANLSEQDFLDSLQLIGIKEVSGDLFTVYQENCPQLRDSLKQGIAMTSYYDLRWRIEVQVARKVLLQETVPKITMRLTLRTKRKVKNQKGEEKGIAKLGGDNDLTEHILQMDPKTLIRITRILEGALSEAMSPYCRRIMRHIK